MNARSDRWSRARVWAARGLTAAGVALILAGHVRTQRELYTRAYSEPDPDGYLVLAKRMARLGPLGVKDDDIFYYQSHVWVENARGDILPKFAPGYPAVMALFYRFGGDEAMFLVSPISGGLALVGAFLLFRLWMSRFSALMALLFLALNPMFIAYSGYLLTHALDLCVVTWGMYFILQWQRDPRCRWGIPAGLLLGFACTVRHVNAMLCLVVLAAAAGVLVSRWRRGVRNQSDEAAAPPPSARLLGWSIAVLLAAYAVFPLLLGLYDRAMFGGWFTTGYALTTEQTSFSWEQLRTFAPNLGQGMLASQMLWIAGPLGLAGILVLGPWSERLMRMLWVFPIVLLYSTYFFNSASSAVTRFLLSTLPAFIGATFALLEKAGATRLRSGLVTASVTGAAVVLALADADSGMRHLQASSQSRRLAEVGQYAATTLNSNAVIFSQWPYSNFLGTLRNFRFYELQAFRGGQHWDRTRTYEPKQQATRTRRLAEFYGQHDQTEFTEMKRGMIRRFLAEGRPVVFLLRLGGDEAQSRELGGDLEWTLRRQFDGFSYGPWRGESGPWGLYEVRSRPQPQPEGRG
jgi:hypothetical protein